MTQSVRILGVDTSLRSTGFGVVEARGSSFSALDYGVLKSPARDSKSGCLKRLNEGISEVVERWKPEAAAIEGVFFCKNVKTSVVLGEARGVVIAVCAVAGLAIYEYAPRRVKQAVVGFGSAGKEQVRKMVMSLLALVPGVNLVALWMLAYGRWPAVDDADEA